MNRSSALVLLGLCAFQAGSCAGSSAERDDRTEAGDPRERGGAGAPAGDRLVTLDRGAQSGIIEPLAVAIREAAAFERLWDEHVASQSPAPPAPAVDFGSRMVLAYFRGTLPTGGYGAEIRDIEQRGDTLHVGVALTNPARGEAVTMALTHPFHIMSAPRVEGPVVFHDEQGADRSAGLAK